MRKLAEDCSSDEENRFQADSIITSCIHARGKVISKLQYNLQQCKSKVTVGITRLLHLSSTDIRERFSALCGISRHTIHTEKYFKEDSYLQNQEMSAEKLNEENVGLDNKVWQCTENCRLNDGDPLNELQLLYENINNCTLQRLPIFLTTINICSSKLRSSNKLGHPLECHINPFRCTSKFLKYLIVKSHFPEVRVIERLIYNMIRLNKDLNAIHKAFDELDVDKLKEIQKQNILKRSSRKDINAKR